MSMEVFHPISEHLTRSASCLEVKRFRTRELSVVRITLTMTRKVRLIILASCILIDLMWSDPDDIDNWAVSPRGAGWLFGGNVTHEVWFALSLCSLVLISASVQPRKLTTTHSACAPAGPRRL